MGRFHFGDFKCIYSEPLHAKTRFFLYGYCTADQHTCLLYTDNSNFFLNPEFQASKFCDCVEGILSEEGFSRAAAHVKMVSHIIICKGFRIEHSKVFGIC